MKKNQNLSGRVRDDAQSSAKPALLLKFALGLNILLLAGALLLASSLYAEKNREARNHRTSQRILDKMSEKLTEYALENRRMEGELRKVGRSRSITVASTSPVH